MECRRIKVMCWRCWLLLLIVLQQFFRACLAASNPCEGFDNVGIASFGSFTFLACDTDPNYQGSQSDTFKWFQDEMELLEATQPHIDFNDAIIDVNFVGSDREGVYTCSYQRNTNPSSRVDGIPSPMCLIVRGIPRFVACPELESKDRCEPPDPIPFYTDEDLCLQVDVKYIGAGGSGSVFEIIAISVSRAGTSLMTCLTQLPPNDSEPVNFSCNPVNPDVEGRMNGNVSTDRGTYVNASFVINPASVSDSGYYTVRVTARDMSQVTNTMMSPETVTMATTHTTITWVASALASVHPSTSTSSIATPGMSSISTAVLSTSPIPMVPATPTSTGPEVLPNGGNDAIIIGVSVVAGMIILILLVGIVSVCLFILHGMCPKLKKQIMDNVRLIRMKTNGREDIITVITEGTTMQNVKAYSQPDFELPGDKNSKSADV